MSGERLVHCRGVGKRYGKHVALADFDLDLGAGEVFGLLGPNGAGKTTFIRILLGLAMPSSGRIELFGYDLFRRRHAAVRQLGAVVEAPLFFTYLTARQTLHHLAALSGGASRARIDQVLALVGLGEVGDKRVAGFSYGMKQRLGIAQALLPETPRLLLLDEPTNGLDPHGIHGIRRLIRYLADELGITIFLSSHLLYEVEEVCERVAIIHQGRKVLDESVAALRAQTERVAVRVRANDAAEAALRGLGGEIAAAEGGALQATWPAVDTDVPALVRQLVDANCEVLEVRRTVRSLEDVFLAHTREGARDVRLDRIRIEETPGTA